MKRLYWGIGVALLLGLLVISLRAVRRGEAPSPLDALPQEEQDLLKAGLTLRDVTLEQPDADGNLIWRVKAEEVTYSPDQRTATVVRPRGELYQDGQLLYRVSADRGEISEDGQLVILRGNILATGVQNQVALQGNILEWRPEQAVMVVRDRVTGSHPQLRASADEVRVYDQENRMELQGQVVANTVVEEPATEPWLKLQADALNWNWETQQVESTQPLRVERFLAEKVTEVLTGDRGQVDIGENRATLIDNVTAQLVDVPLSILSDRAVWEVNDQRVAIDSPLRINNTAQKVTLTARSGQMDLQGRIIYLEQDILVVGEGNDSRLTTDRLTWNLDQETVIAEGAVDYRQGDPQVTVRGPRAVGRIAEQTVVVSGGRVTTEIVPR